MTIRKHVEETGRDLL